MKVYEIVIGGDHNPKISKMCVCSWKIYIDTKYIYIYKHVYIYIYICSIYIYIYIYAHIHLHKQTYIYNL